MKEENWAQTRSLHWMIGQWKKNPEFRTLSQDPSPVIVPELDPEKLLLNPIRIWISIQTKVFLWQRKTLSISFLWGQLWPIWISDSLIHLNPDPEHCITPPWKRRYGPKLQPVFAHHTTMGVMGQGWKTNRNLLYLTKINGKITLHAWSCAPQWFLHSMMGQASPSLLHFLILKHLNRQLTIRKSISWQIITSVTRVGSVLLI